MTGKRIGIAFGVAAFLVAGTVFPGMTAQPPAEEKDPGAALFKSKCSTCHAVSRPLGKTKDREGWTTTVERMRSKGCQLTDQEAGAIVDHLVKIRGLTPP